MNLIITVDVEADNQWSEEKILTVENLKFLPRFQALCEKYGFVPTYLITYEITQDEQAAQMLSEWRKSGKAEIGAHLHPWTMPCYNVKDKPFPCELSDEELENQIKILTGAIEEKFGAKPVSYRAGRWGFDHRQAEILAKFGYAADCSVTPKISWKKTAGLAGGKGGPDFRFHKIRPYRVGGNLLEVPMTILFTGIIKSEKSVFAKFFLGMPDCFLKKVLNKIFFRQKWLRIFPESESRDWIGIYKSAESNELPCLEFMIHSSELMPGGSPYCRDAKSVEFVYKQLELMFELFKKKNVVGATLREFAENYKKYKNEFSE
ncbi:MAG: hypothetical protein V1667_02975 [bacterium]